MTDRLLGYFDVDPRQWRALVSVSWKTLRRRRSSMVAHSRSALQGVWIGLVMYFVMGIVFALVATSASSAGIAAFFVLNFVMVFVASVVLLESGSSIVSPEDILILGPRPVTSRTYFAARMTIVALLILLYDAVLGLPATVTIALKFGVLQGFAWIVAMLLGGFSVGLFMVVIYTTALRYVTPARLKSVMGYIQLLLSFAIYGGYGILAEKMRDYLATMTLARWTVFLPSRWYASIVAVAGGEWTYANVAGVCLSLAVFAFLLMQVTGRIALTYADDAREAAVPIASSPRVVRRRRLRFLLFRRSNDRAIAMLVFRQFRNDVKFRMAVLAILPLTLLYLFQGLKSSAGLTDPFVAEPAEHEYTSSMLIYFAMILFPAILKDEIVRNDMHEAAWVFFSAPVHRGDLILSVRRILMTGFILPYLGLISLVFLWFYGNVFHVLLHMLVIVLCCDVYMLVLSQIRPALPFSLPRIVGERSLNVMVVLVLGSISFLVILGLFMKLLYRTPWMYAAGVCGLALLSVLLRRLLRKRSWRTGERLEFVG